MKNGITHSPAASQANVVSHNMKLLVVLLATEMGCTFNCYFLEVVMLYAVRVMIYG